MDVPAIWGHVPLRHLNFVGRHDLLEQLRLCLGDAGPTAVLHGMGGVGKSQTVVEYVHRHASEYEVVWWIPAEQPAQIKSSFVELAEKIGVPTPGSAEAAVPAVLDALRRGAPHRRWILVFDNADRPQDVRQYFPAGNGHIVVTSRNSEWGGYARPVAVDLFTRAESIELLRGRAAALDAAEADSLAEALGDLPLAVEQAGALIAQTGMRVPRYLHLLGENRTELLDAGTSSEHQLPVATALNVALNRLRQDHPAALRLLELCAFFGPGPISLQLFDNGCAPPVGEPLAGVLNDPIKLSLAIGEISRYSLAKIDYPTHTLQLQRLVQTVLKNRLGPEEKDRMRHAAVVLTGSAGEVDSDLAVTPGRQPRPGAKAVRLGVLVDVEGYTRRPSDLRRLAQRRVTDLADAVVDHLGVGGAAVDGQGTGDGKMIFLPAGVDVSLVLLPLLRAVREQLVADGRRYTDRLRIRMAVTAGPIAPSELGFDGQPASELGRLIDSEVLRAAMAEHEDVDLVVLVSDRLFSIVDPFDEEFTRVSVHGKDYHEDAWIWVGRPPA
ncbi:FxSxx-COOH system tetratricopeptide repeat protein [Actinosynnema sp. NPDC023794]